PPLLLRNSGGGGNHFINFKLVGAKSGRDATGALIRLRAGGLNQVREISAGGSYFSHSDLRAHFGLGSAASAESVEVLWPSGQRQVFRDVGADKFYVVEEGKNSLALQKFDRERASR
ncbi:MAG: ASPIC/UnbV domain-containing protein, partial [Blastocatellia bacterium]